MKRLVRTRNQAQLETQLMLAKHLTVTYPSTTGNRHLRFSQTDPKGGGLHCLYHVFARGYYANHSSSHLRTDQIVARMTALWNHVMDRTNYPNNPARQGRWLIYRNMELNSRDGGRGDLTTIDEVIRDGGRWGTIDHVQLLADAFDVEIIVYTPSGLVASDIEFDPPVVSGGWQIQSRGSHHPPSRQLHVACYPNSVHWTLLTPEWHIANPDNPNPNDPVYIHNAFSHDHLRTPLPENGIIPNPLTRLPPGHQDYNDHTLVAKDRHHLVDDKPYVQGNNGQTTAASQGQTVSDNPINQRNGADDENANAAHNANDNPAGQAEGRNDDNGAIAEKENHAKDPTKQTDEPYDQNAHPDEQNAKGGQVTKLQERVDQEQLIQKQLSQEHNEEINDTAMNDHSDSDSDTLSADVGQDNLEPEEIRVVHGFNRRNPGMRFRLLHVRNDDNLGLYRAFARIYYGDEGAWDRVRQRVLRLYNAVLNPRRRHNLARRARRGLYRAMRRHNADLQQTVVGDQIGGLNTNSRLVFVPPSDNNVLQVHYISLNSLLMRMVFQYMFISLTNTSTRTGRILWHGEASSKDHTRHHVEHSICGAESRVMSG